MEAGKYAKYTGVEVDGRNVKALMDAFRLFPEVGLKPMARRGIGRVESGTIILDASGWYPVPQWLDAFDEILGRVGPAKIQQIGRMVMENAVFPPDIDTFAKGLMSLDVVYHLNHRKNGKVMFDPATGHMIDGIGHYSCELDADGHGATMSCDVPYPCDLDRGIVYGLGKLLGVSVSLEHGPDGCRKNGAQSCRYLIGW